MAVHARTEEGKLQRIDELKRICLSINAEINTLSEDAKDFEDFGEVCECARTMYSYLNEYHAIKSRLFDPDKLIHEKNKTSGTG